ncbi:MAG: TIGR04211 family SH3 domain-containing protein [Desulfamplus sp.]|nr:TIGR04211 family SH3 domain-containing protein [Desulfamplus sp.]
MKNYIVLLPILILTLTTTVSANNYYVSQRIDITIRSGPAVSNKIIAMLPTGEAVTMLEYGKEWSRVQTLDGKEGWVLTRYMTKEVPVSLMLKEAQNKNSQLTAMVEEIKAENSALSGIKERLIAKEKEFDELKKKASNFLEIEQKYIEAIKQLEEQKIFIEKCNSQSHREILYSFSIGAGVLIIGIILGMSAKRKQSVSLL